MKPIINSEFINNKGQKFNLVREIAYVKGGLMHNLGKFVAETNREKCDFFCPSGASSNDGVYIYQTYHNPNIGYRIYQEFADYNFNGYYDEVMIQSLQKRQKYVNQSKFPTGVVTLDKKIIGQEIPYYPNTITLFDLFCKEKIDNPLIYYRQVLSILKEMQECGIYYLDNHAKNFVVNKNKKIQVIDFDPHYIRFDTLERKKHIFENYEKMVNILNSKWNNEETIKFAPVNDFKEAEENLNKMEETFIKMKIIH